MTSYMEMPLRDFLDIRTALRNVLEREAQAREEARNQ